MTQRLNKVLVKDVAACSAVRYLLPNLYLVVPSRMGASKSTGPRLVP